MSQSERVARFAANPNDGSPVSLDSNSNSRVRVPAPANEAIAVSPDVKVKIKQKMMSMHSLKKKLVWSTQDNMEETATHLKVHRVVN